MRFLPVVAMLLITAFVFAEAGDEYLGLWYTKDNESIIEIYKVGNEFFGKIVWLEEPYEEDGSIKLDDENPDEARRNDPILGLVILRNFTVKDVVKLEYGTIYDPKNGKTYDCNIKMEDGDMKIRGYVLGIPLLGRTATWTRCSSMPASNE